VPARHPEGLSACVQEDGETRFTGAPRKGAILKLPADPPPRTIRVKRDTREQLPLSFENLDSCVGTLTTGDYSICGLESVIAIERKCLSDLVSCCGTERERFEAELLRMLAYPVRAVIVEASWTHLENGGWRSRITPESVVGSVLGWIAMGIPFVLAGDRARAQRYAEKI
jgi:DNA excision repair protein ERCC-4